MFVQVFSGRVADGAALHRQFERWATDVRPEAVGFLGSTAGITTKGLFVALVRFESEQSARANSERPEQAAWWDETERCFDGPVAFRESDDLDLLGKGGSDNASFVQVIEGQTSNRARFMELERQIEKGFINERPDFIGSMLVWWPEGTWLEVAYFSSEAETRAAEQRGLSNDLTELFSEWQALAAPSSYRDLSEPWLLS